MGPNRDHHTRARPDTSPQDLERGRLREVVDACARATRIRLRAGYPVDEALESGFLLTLLSFHTGGADSTPDPEIWRTRRLVEATHAAARDPEDFRARMAFYRAAVESVRGWLSVNANEHDPLLPYHPEGRPGMVTAATTGDPVGDAVLSVLGDAKPVVDETDGPGVVLSGEYPCDSDDGGPGRGESSVIDGLSRRYAWQKAASGSSVTMREILYRYPGIRVWLEGGHPDRVVRTRVFIPVRDVVEAVNDPEPLLAAVETHLRFREERPPSLVESITRKHRLRKTIRSVVEDMADTRGAPEAAL